MAKMSLTALDALSQTRGEGRMTDAVVGGEGRGKPCPNKQRSGEAGEPRLDKDPQRPKELENEAEDCLALDCLPDYGCDQTIMASACRQQKGCRGLGDIQGF